MEAGAPHGSGALVGPTAVFEQGVPDVVGGGTSIVTLDDAYWNNPPDREEAGSPNVVGAVAMAQAIPTVLRAQPRPDVASPQKIPGSVWALAGTHAGRP